MNPSSFGRSPATSDPPAACRRYDNHRVVVGKTMDEHLRLAVACRHSFVTDGSDPEVFACAAATVRHRIDVPRGGREGYDAHR